MKQWLAVFIIACLSLDASAQESVDSTLDVEESGFVYIENMNGSVKVIGWDKQQVSVKGTLDRKAEGLMFLTRNGKTKIEVEMPNHRHGNRSNNGGSDLVIHVPNWHGVSFEGINSDIEFSNLTGKVSADTVNGNIEAENVSSKVQLETVNGEIDVSQAEGKVVLSAVNGSITAKDIVGKLMIEAVNGDIEASVSGESVYFANVNGEMTLTLRDVEDVEIETVNGDIEADIRFSGNNGRLEFMSVSGDGELTFDADSSLRIDVEAHAGGKIVNKMDGSKVHKAKYGPSSELSFKYGGGDNHVEVSTVSGRITLKKAAKRK